MPKKTYPQLGVRMLPGDQDKLDAVLNRAKAKAGAYAEKVTMSDVVREMLGLAETNYLADEDRNRIAAGGDKKLPPKPPRKSSSG